METKLYFNTEWKEYNQQELNNEQRKHINKLHELSEMNMLNDSQVDDLVNNYENVTLITHMNNEEPCESYFNKGYTTCKVYINYCYSKPVLLLISIDKVKQLMNDKKELVTV